MVPFPSVSDDEPNIVQAWCKHSLHKIMIKISILSWPGDDDLHPLALTFFLQHFLSLRRGGINVPVRGEHLLSLIISAKSIHKSLSSSWLTAFSLTQVLATGKFWGTRAVIVLSCGSTGESTRLPIIA